jgi:hypothetical protein
MADDRGQTLRAHLGQLAMVGLIPKPKPALPPTPAAALYPHLPNATQKDQ